MKILRFLMISVMFVLLSTCLYAQGLGNTSGTLQGTVVDENGVPLPGVLVTAIGAAGGTKTATTDVDGNFIFPYLAPGTYSVRAELQSFTTIEQSDVELRLGQRTEITFKLKPGQEEMVVVTGETPLVDVSSTTTGANLSSELLSSIPVGRGFANSVSLAPGVTDGGLGGGNVSISGASCLENTFIVDGVNITDPGFGAVGAYSVRFGSLGSGFTPDMVKEIQVKSGGFEPEYGQALGGVVNVVTKSGGNQYSGEGYVYYQPFSLSGDPGVRDPNQYVDALVTNILEEQEIDGGVNLSGPIVKDKLFFFGSYNPRRIERTFTNDPDAPAFSQFPTATRERSVQSYSIKTTANVTANHTVEFSAFGDPSKGKLGFQNSVGLTTVNPVIQRSELEYGSNSQVGRWTGILRPSMFVEAQVARAHNEFQELFPSEGDLYRFDDFTDPTGTGAIIRSGGIGFFDAGSIGNNYQYGLKLTNIWKSHELRYGVQYEDIDYSGGSNYTGPTFTAFNGQQSATGAIVFIQPGEALGYPQYDKVYVTVRGTLSPVPVPTSTAYLNWFAQDSWNITSYLNLKFGIRWERQEMKGQIEDSENITFTGNWAPRLGFTYDYLKSGKSKVYAHFGRFFEKIPNDLAVRALVSEVQTSGYYTCPELTGCSIPGTGQLTGNGTTIVEGKGRGGSLAPYNAHETASQYSDEWVAGIEQEVLPGFSVGGRFINRNVKNVIEDIQVNTTAPCSPYVGVDESLCIPPGMIYEDFLSNSSFYFITNQDGHYPGFPELVRDYRAIELTAEKRLSHNWQLLASYRYAKLEGNYEGLFRRDNEQSDPNITSLGDFAQCRLNPDGSCTNSPGIGFTFDEGPLPNDNRHIVKLYGSYQFDMGLNTGFGFNFNTGSPITELGAIPFYGSFERLLTPRGEIGRTENITTFDVHADYGIPFGDSKLTLGVDVFNLFNSAGVVEVVQSSEIDNRTYNPRVRQDFLLPDTFQSARAVRFLAKYSF